MPKRILPIIMTLLIAINMMTIMVSANNIESSDSINRVIEYCNTNNLNDSSVLTLKDATKILFVYHDITLDYYRADLNTLDWNYRYRDKIITREEFLQYLIESFGVVPYQEIDHCWNDENLQDEKCRSYIDLAYRLGITVGTGDNYFSPKDNLTLNTLMIFLQRAEDCKELLENEILFPIIYESEYTKFFRSCTLKGIYELPEYVWKEFIRRDWKYEIVSWPVKMWNFSVPRRDVAGYAIYDYKICGNVAWMYEDHEYLEIPLISIHELGHFVDKITTTSITADIMKSEINNLEEIVGKYCRTNKYEYFAEAFLCYITYGDEHRDELPYTYEMIDKALNEVAESYNLHCNK